MKKYAALLAVTALISTPVLAAQNGGFVDPNAPTTSVQQGGFSGPNGTVATVKQAQDMKDDAWVTMRGKIEKRVGDEEYMFRDATGTMTVEIDDKRWDGQNISPSDNVELQGKLDKDFNSVELDVKQIKKVQHQA
uniref:YgiW/YdeI family stress tolerance OB fold protein n=1 Tax=Pantoea sp. IMH TaxID=1267600 RepID=UPI0005720443|nr:YgiW/YdeI family stress tolerance OB fold protein [Pantoea sp. IMH]